MKPIDNPSGWKAATKTLDNRTVIPEVNKSNSEQILPNGNTSDGSTASYYELSEGSSELQHLISDRDMNAQIGEIFRACYRYGRVAHSECLRDAKKIKFYAEAEIERLEKLEKKDG